jgi:imidazolonepropionase
MGLLIKNIGVLVHLLDKDIKKAAGRQMSSLQCLEDAWLLCENGLISGFGRNDQPSEKVKTFKGSVIDARGRMVFPSFCDSHTHLVFPAPREGEFVDRIRGLSYEDIAAKGGGILNSAKKLNETPEDELFNDAWIRLQEIISQGTGAVEIKSGYGLTVEGELKMLRVIRRLKGKSPIPIKANFLGAHAMPLLYKQNRKGYIDLMLNEMLPVIASEGLADYIDVFCDRGFYTVEETDLILEAGAKYGLRPKIHANELGLTGGIQAGVKHNALSVDHLEFTGDEEIKCLLDSSTMPTLLPSTAFFLGLHDPPARKMIDAGLPVALASDYNPGSSPSGRMSFIISLACICLKMLPEEAIQAATINSAYAMGLEDECGSITAGKRANLFITKPIPSIAYIPYRYGNDLIDEVIINGELFTPEN